MAKMTKTEPITCICGVTDEPGVIDLHGGGGEYPPSLIGTMTGNIRVGSIELLVCCHCGLVYCGMNGRIQTLNKGN